VPRQYLFNWIADNAPYRFEGADDFPGDVIDLAGTDLPWSDFLDRLSYVQPFIIARGVHGDALYNPAALDDGEVQIFRKGPNWIFRAKKASVASCFKAMNRMLGSKLELEKGSSPDVKITFVAQEETSTDLQNTATSHIVSQFKSQPTIQAGGIKLKADPIITVSWPVTFTSGKLITLGDEGFTYPESSGTTGRLATTLNNVFGENTVTPGSGSLLIRGSEKTTYQVREALVKWLDVPYDQVRLDLWVFSGSDRKHNEPMLADRMQVIQAGIRIAKGVENALTMDLERFILDEQLFDTTALMPFAQETRVNYGIFGLLNPAAQPSQFVDTTVPNPWDDFYRERSRIRPFIDQLMYLAMADRKRFDRDLSDYIKNPASRTSRALDAVEKELQSRLMDAELLKTPKGRLDQRRIVNLLLGFTGSLRKSTGGAYPSLRNLIGGGDVRLDMRTINDVMKAYRYCHWGAPADKRTNPQRLATLASTSDALIKNATDAITGDMRTAVINPLVSWIQVVSADGADGRPSLVLNGSQSITVTSTLPAATAATATSNLPYTAPPATDKAKVEGIVGGLDGVNPFNSAGVLQLLKSLADLTQPQTTYTRLDTGMSMSVRPSVLPGGRSARLQIEAVATTDVDKDRGDYVNPDKPLDTMKSQRIATDVQVNTFDLFELASFTISNTGPGDHRWTIPVLDGLPLIGNMFRGPRGTISTVHRSLVICHATIQPKTLDIARRYDPN